MSLPPAKCLIVEMQKCPRCSEIYISPLIEICEECNSQTDRDIEYLDTMQKLLEEKKETNATQNNE